MVMGKMKSKDTDAAASARNGVGGALGGAVGGSGMQGKELFCYAAAIMERDAAPEDIGFMREYEEGRHILEFFARGLNLVFFSTLIP